MFEEWKCEADVIEAAFWTIHHKKFDSFKNITISKNDSNKFYFCANCKTSLRKKKVPTIALMKDLHFPEKVSCIDKLTRLEERLIAPRHFFKVFTHTRD